MEYSTLAMFLILTTWVAWASATWGIGILLVSCVNRCVGSSVRSQAQAGIWVGLFALIVLVIFTNFFFPLTGSASGLLAFIWILFGSPLFLLWLFRIRTHLFIAWRMSFRFRNSIPLLLIFLLALSAVIVAWFSAAEPMDYDAGLYRLGLINYAAEFPTIPGLANIHGRFGFNSSMAPLAAFLENGIWSDNGFRLVTGFVFFLFFLEVGIRIAVPRRRTVGDYLVVLGWAFSAWIVLSDSGRWIASPAVDVIALILTLVSFAYLVDFINPPSRRPWMASIALLTAALSASIRPLGWVVVVSTIITVSLVLVRTGIPRKVRQGGRLYLIPSLLGVLVLGVLLMVRDTLLSGWLLFPVRFFPLQVDWRAVSPEGESLAITWWGRAPFKTIEQAQAQDWFGPWLGSFVASREMEFLVIATFASLVPFLWSTGRRAWGSSKAKVALSLFPATVTGIVWFVTAPDIRFAWAIIFAIVSIPLAFLLANGAYPRWFYRAVFLILLVWGLFTNWGDNRFNQRGSLPQEYNLGVGGFQLVTYLGPPNITPTVSGTLADGTQIVYPRDGENCYQVFPLCLLPGTGKNVELRGSDLRDGFRIAN